MSGATFATRSVAQKTGPNAAQTVVSAVTRAVSKGVLHSLKLDGTTSESSVELCFVTPHNEYQYHVKPALDERNAGSTVRRKSMAKAEAVGGGLCRNLPRKSKTVAGGQNGSICPPPQPRKSRTKSEGVGDNFRCTVSLKKAKGGGQEGSICRSKLSKSKTKSEGVGDNLKHRPTLPLKKAKGGGLEGSIRHPTPIKSKIESEGKGESLKHTLPLKTTKGGGLEGSIRHPLPRKSKIESEGVGENLKHTLPLKTTKGGGQKGSIRHPTPRKSKIKSNEMEGRGYPRYQVYPSRQFARSGPRVMDPVIKQKWLEAEPVIQQKWNDILRAVNSMPSEVKAKRCRNVAGVSRCVAANNATNVLGTHKHVPQASNLCNVKNSLEKLISKNKKVSGVLLRNLAGGDKEMKTKYHSSDLRHKSNGAKSVPKNRPTAKIFKYKVIIPPKCTAPLYAIGLKKKSGPMQVVNSLSHSRPHTRVRSNNSQKVQVEKPQSNENTCEQVFQLSVPPVSVSPVIQGHGRMMSGDARMEGEDSAMTLNGRAAIDPFSSSRSKDRGPWTLESRAAIPKSCTSRSKERKTSVTRVAMAESSSSREDRNTLVTQAAITEFSSSMSASKTLVTGAAMTETSSSRSKERTTSVGRAAIAESGQLTYRETGPNILSKRKETALLFYLESAVDLLKGKFVSKEESAKADVPSLTRGESELELAELQRPETERQDDKNKHRLKEKPAARKDQGIRHEEEVMSASDSVEARGARHAVKSRLHTKDALRRQSEHCDKTKPDNMSQKTQRRPRKYDLSPVESSSRSEATQLRSSHRRTPDISRYEASSRETIDEASDDNRNRRHGRGYRRSKTLPLEKDDQTRRREHFSRKSYRKAVDATADNDGRKQRDRRERDRSAGRNNRDRANNERGERKKLERRKQIGEQKKERRSGNRDGIKRRANEYTISEDERSVYEKGIREISKKEKMYSNRKESKENSDCSMSIDELSSQYGFSEPSEADDQKKGTRKTGRHDHCREKYSSPEEIFEDSPRSRHHSDFSDAFESNKMYDKVKRAPVPRKEIRVKERVMRCDQDSSIARDGKVENSHGKGSRALKSVKDSVLWMKERSPKTFCSAKDSVRLINDKHARRNCNKEQIDKTDSVTLINDKHARRNCNKEQIDETDSVTLINDKHARRNCNKEQIDKTDSVTLINDKHARRNCNKERIDDGGQDRLGRNKTCNESKGRQNAVKDIRDSSDSSVTRGPATAPGEGEENGKQYLSLSDAQSIEEEMVLLKKCLDVLKANQVGSG